MRSIKFIIISCSAFVLTILSEILLKPSINMGRDYTGYILEILIKNNVSTCDPFLWI